MCFYEDAEQEKLPALMELEDQIEELGKYYYQIYQSVSSYSPVEYERDPYDGEWTTTFTGYTRNYDYDVNSKLDSMLQKFLAIPGVRSGSDLEVWIINMHSILKKYESIQKLYCLNYQSGSNESPEDVSSRYITETWWCKKQFQQFFNAFFLPLTNEVNYWQVCEDRYRYQYEEGDY
jgi:hypothetical protein